LKIFRLSNYFLNTFGFTEFLLKMKIAILLFLLAGQAAVQIKTSFPEDNFKPLKTGVTTRDFYDSSRSNWLGNGPRPLRSVIWYPAGKGGRPEIINDSSQFTLPTTVIRDAKISDQRKRYPLIIISHGSQGNAQQMRWLGYYLASRGYIAVAINHNGSDEEERKTGLLSLSDFCMWERPKDISCVLDKMLKEAEFSDRIDTARIASAGFSLGGATAIWVAGAIFTIEELAKNEPEPPAFLKPSINRLIELKKTDSIVSNSFKHSADSFRDNRIKAVFALSPAIGQGFTKEGLKSINIPVQIVAGDADIIAPIDRNAGHYAKNIPTARPLIILPGERGHYMTPSSGKDRAIELREVSQLAYHFFEEYLK
jgi:predicted dienelactone hydrolase